MIVELEQSKDVSMDKEMGKPIGSFVQKGKKHHKKHHHQKKQQKKQKHHHKHHSEKSMIQSKSQGLPENAGNLDNVHDNRQQSDVISQTRGYGSKDITKQHDHTQNTAGSGKQVYAQTKDLPQGSGNLPNVDGDRQQSDLISQTKGYGSSDITKQHDHTQNTAGSGKEVYAQTKSLPQNSGNLDNVDDNRQQSDLISQTKGYGSNDITKQHDHTQNTAGSGKEVYA